MNEKKKRIFSGAAPSGDVLTIGNYIGALTSWANLQDEYDNIFCIVDLHTITVRQDPKLLKERITEFAKNYIACGIDPKRSVIFIQSDRPEHAELAWILSCYTYFGELSRMTQFKEKSEKHKKNVTAGLFNYPTLMAADILLYDTDLVPVGEDQKQHIELTRDIAERINNIYGRTFVVPEGFIPKQGARVMGLLNPASKMDKSDQNKQNIITLRDEPVIIRKKIQKAVTDSGSEIVYDKEKKPALANLLTIYSAFADEKIEDIVKKYQGKGYADFKKELAEVIIYGLAPIQDRLRELDEDPKYIAEILARGSGKIAPIAAATLARVKEKIGLG